MTIIVGAKGYQIAAKEDFDTIVKQLAEVDPDAFVKGESACGYNGEQVAIRASQIIAVVEA